MFCLICGYKHVVNYVRNSSIMGFSHKCTKY